MDLTVARSHPLWTTGRAARIAWALFALLALSLSLLGIVLYRTALATVCDGLICLPGQMTSADGSILLATGYNPIQYADNALILYLYLTAFIFCLLTAALFIWRGSGNGAAVAGAFALTATGTGTLAAVTTALQPAVAPAAQFVAFVGMTTLLPFLAALPDGRFRPGWLRWAAVAAVPAAALVAFGVAGPPGSYWPGVVVIALAFGSALYHYAAGRGTVEEEGAAWALAGVILLLLTQWMSRPLALWPLPSLALSAVPATYFPIFLVLNGLLFVAGLACLTVALLGDELFRIEVVLNRALVYALLTLLIIGVYALIVGYLSLLFQAQGSVWLSLVATGLIAVLFQPLRERVQRFVNGLLYGRRDDPYRVIAGLGRRLESAFEPAAVPAAIVETVRESLRLPYAAVAVPRVGGEEVVAADGTPSGEPARFPISWQGATVGHLLVSPRRGDAELPAADRALLADLAQQAGPAIHGVRLVADLQRLSADLQQSREQLVLAREEERRRLRRDLHDDLAPTLAGLSLRAGTISDLIATDPTRAAALADTLDGAIRDAVGDIRRLVYDLRPPTLDDLGLLAAIRERALDYGSRGLHVSVDAPETLPPLPAAVEVAAYRVAQEGMMNVIRHAGARNCIVRLAAGDDLTIEIGDDGVGIDPARKSGIGLRSIRERAVELGGTCEVLSGPEGTRIFVSLPLNREAGS